METPFASSDLNDESSSGWENISYHICLFFHLRQGAAMDCIA